MAEDKTIHLEVVTPARAVLKERVTEVVLPGVNGQLGILPGHLPLLTALDIGELIVRSESSVRTFYIDGGFAEVLGHRVTVLTDDCQGVDDIDVEHARRLLQSAEDELGSLEERSKRELIDADVLELHRKQIKRARTRVLMGEKR